MSIVTNTDDIPEHEMQELLQSAEDAEHLFNVFVKKITDAGGTVIEDESIAAFMAFVKVLPENGNAAAQFLAAARLNGYLIAQLRAHLEKEGTPTSFGACNLFVQKLTMTVHRATMEEEHSHVH
jgi:hypothetical protein